MVTAIRQAGCATIVDIRGNVVHGEQLNLLRKVVGDLLREGHKKILFNLREVNYIDTSGVGYLVSAFASVRRQGGEFKLLNLNKNAQDVMETTKLCTIFDILDDEVTAIASFSQSTSATAS